MFGTVAIVLGEEFHSRSSSQAEEDLSPLGYIVRPTCKLPYQIQLYYRPRHGNPKDFKNNVSLICQSRRPSSTLLLDLLLMENPRNLRHPFLPPFAPELPLRWKISRMIESSRHDISEILNRSSSNLQNTASTFRAKLSTQHRTAAIIGFVDCGLF